MATVIPVGFQEHPKHACHYPTMVQMHHVDAVQSGLTVLPHWHREIEIFHIIEGEAIMDLEYQQVHVTTGDVIICGSYCVHSIRPAHVNCYYYVILLDIEPYLDNLLANLHIPTYFQTRDQQVVDYILRIFDEHHLQSPYYHSLVMSECLSLLSYSCRLANDVQEPVSFVASHSHDSLAKQATLFLNKHFQEPITLEDVCSELHCSKSHLNRCLRQSTGKSTIEFLNMIRCSNALQLIRQGQYTVRECAERSGFNNMSYFSRKFQEIYGKKPKDVRRNLKDTPEE